MLTSYLLTKYVDKYLNWEISVSYLGVRDQAYQLNKSITKQKV